MNPRRRRSVDRRVGVCTNASDCPEWRVLRKKLKQSRGMSWFYHICSFCNTPIVFWHRPPSLPTAHPHTGENKESLTSITSHFSSCNMTRINFIDPIMTPALLMILPPDKGFWPSFCSKSIIIFHTWLDDALFSANAHWFFFLMTVRSKPVRRGRGRGNLLQQAWFSRQTKEGTRAGLAISIGWQPWVLG